MNWLEGEREYARHSCGERGWGESEKEEGEGAEYIGEVCETISECGELPVEDSGDASGRVTGAEEDIVHPVVPVHLRGEGEGEERRGRKRDQTGARFSLGREQQRELGHEKVHVGDGFCLSGLVVPAPCLEEREGRCEEEREGEGTLICRAMYPVPTLVSATEGSTRLP
jgi:hypothetical protein